MSGRPSMSIKDRFMEKVAVQETGCWLWKAYCMPKGYGLFSIDGANRLAHRISYQLFVGTPDPALDVMHSCDNPGCVNPKHLSLGTRVDNMQDCKKKGRNTPGEKHGRAKLTEAQAVAIKNATGLQRDIGKEFGISQTTVYEIKAGRKWQHLSA